MATILSFCAELNRSAAEIPFPSFGNIARTVASFADARTGDNCYPTLRQLAAATGYSHTWIEKGIDWLESAGWLEVQRVSGAGRGRGWRRNSYRLRVPHWKGRQGGNPQLPRQARRSFLGNLPKNLTQGAADKSALWSRIVAMVGQRGRYRPPVPGDDGGIGQAGLEGIAKLGGWYRLCGATLRELHGELRAQFVRD